MIFWYAPSSSEATENDVEFLKIWNSQLSQFDLNNDKQIELIYRECLLQFPDPQETLIGLNLFYN